MLKYLLYIIFIQSVIHSG